MSVELTVHCYVSVTDLSSTSSPVPQTSFSNARAVARAVGFMGLEARAVQRAWPRGHALQQHLGGIGLEVRCTAWSG